MKRSSWAWTLYWFYLMALLLVGFAAPLGLAFNLPGLVRIASWTAASPMPVEFTRSAPPEWLSSRVNIKYWMDSENPREVDLSSENFERLQGPFLRRWAFLKALLQGNRQHELEDIRAVGYFLRRAICGEKSPMVVILNEGQEIWSAEIKLDSESAAEGEATSLEVKCLE